MARSQKQKPVIEEIATFERDITRNYLGRVLLNPDKVLSTEARGEGLQVYEDIERDARVFSNMQTRKLAVTGKEWSVEPASDSFVDAQIADFVEEVFREMDFDRACNELLDGILKGFKPCEIMWDYSEGQIWIRELRGRDPRRFTFDVEGRLRLLTWQNMIEGEELPERKFQLFRYGDKNSNPFGTGLGQKLYWPVWFKKNGVKFWAVFLEKFGQPTPWGKYPPGTEKQKQDELLEALKAIQTDLAVITPDTMAIDLLEASRSTSVDSYEKWLEFWNAEISTVILGQTATTEGTPGKLGEETAREQVRQDIIKADADLLCEWLNNQSVRWLVDYNFPGVKKYPKIWKRTEPEKDLKPLAERDRIIIKEIGLPVSPRYLYDTYGIPEPQEGEEILRPLSSEDEFPFSAKKEAEGFSFAEELWVDFYLERLAPSLEKIRKKAAEEIESWLRSQTSPPSEDAFKARVTEILEKSYKEADKKAVLEVLHRAYAEAKRETGLGIAFGGMDARAINFLAGLDHFYLSQFLRNEDARSSLMAFLKERYLEGGEGLFGRGDPATIKEMVNLLSQKMVDLEGYQVRRIAETGIQRARNWAHLNDLHSAGIEELEIVEPTQECPFCQAMNGQIIEVPLAYSRMAGQLAMTPEEFEEELKSIEPTFDGSRWNVEDYVSRGLLPPYHPHCRGRVIKRVA